MRKLAWLLLVVPAIASAQDKEPDWSKMQITVNKLSPTVLELDSSGEGFSGGNIGVSVGDDGILLVDSKFAPLAPKIEAALKTVSDKPIKFLINTHFHGDHTGGNPVFGMKSTILAHENTRKRMMAGRGKDSPPAPAAALPVITFEDKVVVHLNGEDIRAIHMPAGHTDTDVVVFFTKSNVVHMGDDFFNGLFPFIDTEGGGSAKGLIADIEKLLTEIPADAKIIPGHGPVGTVKDLRAFHDMMKDCTAIVEKGVKAGKTVDQLKKDKVLAKYDKWAWQLTADNFIEMLYGDLKKK